LVEGAGLGVVFEAPAFVEEFVAGEDFATATAEEGEHLHFADGEFDLDAVPAGEKALGMDLPGAEEEEIGPGRSFVAAEEGADAGEEFMLAERLAEEVIGTEFEAEDDIDFLGLGGEEEDGGVPIVASDGTTNLVAAGMRHHDVEEDETGTVGRPMGESFAAVLGGDDVMTFTGEKLGESFAGDGVVFGQEDGHGECGVRSAECGVRSAEWSVVSGQWGWGG
jgi:hypothetical protein